MKVYQERAITVTLSLTAENCPTCGVVYALTEEFLRRKRETGQSWYCPNGHSVVFRTSDLDAAKQEAARAKHQADQAKAQAEEAYRALESERLLHELTNRSLSATKGVVTKMRKRAQAGVCPVPGCKRSFGPDTALARHLATKHPDWQPETEGDHAGKAER